MLTIDQNPERMSARHIAVMALRDAGVANDEIAKTLGITKTYPSKIAGKLQKRYDLTSSKYLKLASHAVKTTLQGKTIGDVDKITTGNVMEAAAMVYDRAQPIKREDAGNQATPVAPINVSLLFSGDRAQAQVSISQSIPLPTSPPGQGIK